MRGEISKALDYDYKGSVEIRHLLDVIVERVGLDEIKKRVTNPLRGTQGCMLLRLPDYPAGRSNRG